jgi:hypothetical protein
MLLSGKYRLELPLTGIDILAKMLNTNGCIFFRPEQVEIIREEPRHISLKLKIG